jgi:hypothetical protein
VVGGSFNDEIASRTDDRFDGRYLRGPIGAIPYHRFTTDLLWDLPSVRGGGRGMSFIAAGWTLSAIFTAQTGMHLTPYQTGHCASGTNCYGQEKVDLVPSQDPNTGTKSPDAWINTTAVTNRDFFDSGGRPIFVGRFGTAGKGIIDGPHLMTLDAGLFKDFALTERWRVRLQSQVRNLPNHPNFANPDMNLSSGNYNRIRSLAANASSRVIVAGARITF